MELKVFLTYIGLLIAAYNVNPEYRKIKTKLSLKSYKVLFYSTLFLLFVSNNKWIKYQLIHVFQIDMYFHHWIWVSKYHIVVFLNLFSLYKIFTATKLNKNNSQIFFELIKNLEVEKKYDLKSKLIKENLDNIFQLKNYQKILFKIQNNTYNFISPNSNHFKIIKKEISKISEVQKEYLDNDGDLNKINEIGKILDTKYTKIEKFRNNIAKYIKSNTLQNYFFEIYHFILDKRFIKYIIKNDEQFGLEILRYIAKYKYFTESHQYTEYFLKKIFSNKNSLVFKSPYDKEIINFLKENQQYKNGFDLGLILCEAIEKLIVQNQKELQKNSLNNSKNKVYKHICDLYEILRCLDPDEMHLAGTPYYIQKELVKSINFSEKKEDQNLAFQLLLNQLYAMKDLELKTKNNYFIEHNFDSLLEELLKIENINDKLALEIALNYSDYIFDEHSKIELKNRVENFIDKTNNQFIISVYIKVFDKFRRYNGKDYISYTKMKKKFQQSWSEINVFLKVKEE